jgi:hypothetical protein
MGAGHTEVQSRIFSIVSADNKKTFLRHLKKEYSCIKETFKKNESDLSITVLYVLYTNIYPAPIEFQQNVPL